MARAGRPSKATEVHAREGTLKTTHAQTPLLIGGRVKPKPPEWLHGEARKAYTAMVNDLWKAGILDKVDASLIVSAATCMGEIVDATKDIEKNGLTIRGAMGGVVKNPSVTVRQQARAEFRQLSDLLGIGPSARARLANMGVKNPETGKDNVPGVQEFGNLQVVNGGAATG